MSKDIHGKKISVGDYVKILSIDTGFIETLPDNEKLLVQSLIGSTLQVENVEDPYIYVEKRWDLEDGEKLFHSICLVAKEIERIEN